MRKPTLVLGTFATWYLLAASLVAEIPRELKDIVIGAEKRATINLTLRESSFEALQAFSELPYLVWPRDKAASIAVPHDQEGCATWLNGVAENLGYTGFNVSFKNNAAWHGSQVWVFELSRNGMALHDARIEVHWNGGRLIGIVNHIPGPVRTVKDLAVLPHDEEWVYDARKNDDRSYDLLPARVTRVRRPTGEEVIIKAENQVLTRRFVSADRLQWIDPTNAVFTEYDVPSGSFPDQISVDEHGIVWFSQPLDDWITEFDPVAETFLQHPTTGASTPDGLIVGTEGRVWSGMYSAGGLGVWNSVTSKFNNYPAPYGNPRMAAPVETSDGTVWVTDHERNRISEFDPSTNTWLQSLVMPTPACWVVQGFEDKDHGQIYFTEYLANNLAKIAVGGSQVIDIPTPGGGVAFCVYSDNKVYYVRGNEFGIGAYDVNTQQITEYDFPIDGELGGPMWIAPNGHIVTGTRSDGYIMIFNPTSESFKAFRIPTASPGLKDGMTVGSNGIIWFTESGANKIAKLTLLPLLPKSISER